MKNTPHRYFTFAVPVHAPHFDDPALRWSTFAGEFLAPIVRDRSVEAFLFLNHAMANYELRFAAVDYKPLEARLRLRAQRLGIQINGNPTDGETIGQTYAENRFIAQNRLGDADAAMRRSVLVFRAMHAACELYLDNLVPQGNYWQCANYQIIDTKKRLNWVTLQCNKECYHGNERDSGQEAGPRYADREEAA